MGNKFAIFNVPFLFGVEQDNDFDRSLRLSIAIFLLECYSTQKDILSLHMRKLQHTTDGLELIVLDGKQELDHKGLPHLSTALERVSGQQKFKLITWNLPYTVDEISPCPDISGGRMQLWDVTLSNRSKQRWSLEIGGSIRML